MSESSDYMELSPSNLTKFPPARNLEILSQVSQLFIYLFTGWTDVLQPLKFFHGHVHFRQTGHDQEKAEMLKSLSISKYMISILKAHCHPPINDRSIANASCTAIGSPPLKSRPSLQAQVSKTMKIRVPDRG
ncbi:hypothetical protein TNCV_3195921 [Trichonephila clavipes]|nr:hypothetical protein TNCV_3195921 [Trichonephila clavipes]